MWRIGLSTVMIAVGASGAGAAEMVNVYSSRHYDTDRALYEGFTDATGIEVNLIEGDADELIERIKAEGPNSPADLLITVDAGRLQRAEEAEILQPVQSAVLDERVPENLRDPEGRWYGLSQRVRVLVVSKERVEPGAITTYEQLAEPEWAGRVCIRSSGSIYNQSLLASMIETEGAEAAEAWAAGLVENLARPPAGGDRDQIRAVAAGECDVAVANHYYLARLLTGEPADQEAAAKVELVFPNQQGRGAHANISGAGVVVTAPHEANAIAFLEYLTSAEAQQMFALGNYEYPIVGDVELDPVLTAWGPFETDAVNASSFGDNNAEAVMIMDRVGWK